METKETSTGTPLNEEEYKKLHESLPTMEEAQASTEAIVEYANSIGIDFLQVDVETKEGVVSIGKLSSDTSAALATSIILNLSEYIPISVVLDKILVPEIGKRRMQEIKQRLEALVPKTSEGIPNDKPSNIEIQQAIHNTLTAMGLKPMFVDLKEEEEENLSPEDDIETSETPQ